MNLQEIAKRLHGEVNGGWVNIRGHGHSKDDSSLGIRFDPNAPDGFRVHSLADDDPEVCRAHVKKLLTDIAKGGSISLDLDEFPESQQKEKLNAALRLWDEALPIENTPAALYLAARKCAPGQGDDWRSELRFHPRCRFGGVSAPVLIAAMRCAITCKFQGIHRTAFEGRRLRQARNAERGWKPISPRAMHVQTHMRHGHEPPRNCEASAWGSQRRLGEHSRARPLERRFLPGYSLRSQRAGRLSRPQPRGR